MKKTVKKPTNKKVQKPSTSWLIEHELLHLRVSEIEPLKKRIAELESTTLKVGQRVVYNEPKEPETFGECVKNFDTAYGLDGCLGNPTNCAKGLIETMLLDGEGVPSEKRAKQLAAIAKMMTVADALNGGIDGEKVQIGTYYYYEQVKITTRASNSGLIGSITFKDSQTAEKAIKILGEDVIRTAFGI